MLPRVCVLGLLFWGLGAAPAAATPAERGAVLVYTGRPAPRAGGRAAPPPLLPAAAVAQELRQALAERRRVVVEGAIDQGLRAHADQLTQPLLMKLGGVRELLRLGQRRLGEVELEQAAAALEEAERRCGDLLLLPEAPALLAEVLRWRGVALFELRRRAEAQVLFRRSLVLAPAAGLTEADVRPEIALAFRRVAADLGPPAPVEIAPQLGEGLRTPAVLLAAASVAIDGAEVPLARSRGVAEGAVHPGEHVVVVRAPGYLPTVARAELRPGEPLRVVLQPDQTETALSGLRRAPSAAGLKALCGALALGDVLVAAVGRDGGEDVLAGQRFRCATLAPGAPELLRAARRPHDAPPPFGGVGPRPREVPPAALRVLSEGLLARLFRDGPAPLPASEEAREPTLLALPALARPRPAPPPRVPIYARPWLWVGAAVVVTGVLLGVALRPQPPPETTLVVDPRGFALRF